jgi:hypothetical protein
VQVIWVWENISQQKSFYNELDTYLLISSALLWKRNNPITKDHILYCDQMTREYLTDIKADTQNIWSDIKILPTNKHIDKSVFWASSKLEVLRYVDKPTLIMDHDFLVYKPIIQFLNTTPIFCHEEDGINYYPTRFDPLIRSLSKLINTPETKAINCCFNYFPNPKLANSYAKLSLDIMTELTNSKKALTSKYLIFAEQLVLKYLLDYNNIKYNTLLKGIHISKNDEFKSTEKGIFELHIHNKFFKHYWKDKPKIKKSIEGYDLKEEITILKNILKGSKCSISLTSDNS